MILFTHAAVGAALGRMVPGGPLASFAVGFASHFLLDAIPHQDYKLRSSRRIEGDRMATDMALGRDFVKDLVKIGCDCSAGFAASALLFGARDGGQELALALSGALGGVLPDALQFAYFKIRRQPLIALQRFHMSVANDLEGRPVFGRLTQLMAIIAAVALSLYLK